MIKIDSYVERIRNLSIVLAIVLGFVSVERSRERELQREAPSWVSAQSHQLGEALHGAQRALLSTDRYDEVGASRFFAIQYTVIPTIVRLANDPDEVPLRLMDGEALIWDFEDEQTLDACVQWFAEWGTTRGKALNVTRIDDELVVTRGA